MLNLFSDPLSVGFGRKSVVAPFYDGLGRGFRSTDKDNGCWHLKDHSLSQSSTVIGRTAIKASFCLIVYFIFTLEPIKIWDKKIYCV